MTDVIVFNAGGQQVLHRVSLKHAISMLYRQVARVHEAVPGERFGPYPGPVRSSWSPTCTRAGCTPPPDGCRAR